MECIRHKFLFSLCFAFSLRIATASPSIEITNIPPWGSFLDLGGRVLNATPTNYRVAIFLYDGSWYSKPTCAQPLVVIQTDSSWTADVTTGPGDQYATKFAALLVSTNFSEPCVLGDASLPTNVTVQAVASAFVDRDDPGVRRFDFSGYNWSVKTSSGKVGPGPNYFSDSTNNAWLDAQRQLHLRITHSSNKWQCVEIITRRTFGYGQYRFQIESDLDGLDRYIVLGLFTWSDDPAFNDREIDIEFSRWADAADTNNAQYVVQPYDALGHLTRFAAPAGLTNSTHSFIWETNQVSYQSLRGDFAATPNPADIINQWIYTPDVPPTGDENLHVNFWLYQGHAPSNGNETEVVLKNFEFVPLGTPQPAQFASVAQTANGDVQLNVNGQMDRRYELQVSSNFVGWLPLGTFLATNTSPVFLDTNVNSFNLRFYRALTLP